MSESLTLSEHPLSIVWIRRDMRLYDHAALEAALASGGHAVLPVFIFDSDVLKRFDNQQDRRLSFLAETLLQMHAELRERAGGMVVAYGKAEELIPQIARTLQARQVICAEDFEPATRKRDAQVKKALPENCRFVQVIDHVIHHPDTVLKDDGDPYKVFTPYSRSWLSKVNQYSYAEKTVSNDAGRYADFGTAKQMLSKAGVTLLDTDGSAEKMLAPVGYKAVELGEWQVDDSRKRLHRFVESQVAEYKEARDFMAQPGTSKLSPYLRFGLVSVRECARLCSEHSKTDAWLNELIWREFYHAILYHYPDVVEQDFNEKYRGKLDWSQSSKDWDAFCEGKTGFPIVDAAIRELLHTGWMHNRARMIVASFLTKDLHIDWRKGEEFFAQHLMDYELSSNNGGWQWAASTGTDAQPYFRIFNPLSQSKKFDAEGAYIRQYVPALAKVDKKQVHAPDAATRRECAYPEPLVDHSKAREKTLQMFKAVS
ncbi:MAG: deoxyribodipyrimidine photolyase [Rickettsiales bacterium]|nr:deoxyribodipyrimidine photolyase [Rickettsiales bacterium]